MAWPQAPQPAPAPQPAAAPGSSLDVGALITLAGAVLTFLFSFVRIYKADGFGGETGWSVWTTDFAPGLFGVGTWIPFFALVAGALAAARAFAGMGDKEVLGFKVIQLQLVAVVFAVLLWLGYLISILFAGDSFGDVELGGGMFLLFISLALTAGGTGFSMMGGKLPSGGGAPAAAPGQWPAPTPPPAPGGPFPQPGAGYPAPPGAAPAPPPVAPDAWNQAPAAPQPYQPPAPAAPQPGQWQPDPAGGYPPPAAPPQQPPPPPQGGALIDPGTQVIPGPPPAPPADDPNAGYPPPPPPPG